MSKKTRIRLTPEQAEFLGFEPKPGNKSGNHRYWITKDQLSLLGKKREFVTGKSTLRNDSGDVVMEWTKTSVSKANQIEMLNEIADGLKDDLKKFKSKPKVRKLEFESDLLTQYTLTDFHLGMMSWREETGADWDLKIAKDLFLKWFEKSVEMAPNSDHAVLANIGDFLHWDGLEAVTPASKHVLDADGRFSKLVRTAVYLIRSAVDMMLEKHNHVRIIMAEGNHDPASSVWLREMFDVFYEDDPSVSVDCNPDPYYCIEHGKVVLFYHHGHKRRQKDLDSVFAYKFKKEWGASEFAYGHTGHLHHMSAIETNLMILEQHRTLAAKDSYASRGGWQSGRDGKIITYHKNYGEVGRITVSPDMLK